MILRDISDWAFERSVCVHCQYFKVRNIIARKNEQYTCTVNTDRMRISYWREIRLFSYYSFTWESRSIGNIYIDSLYAP